MKRTMRSDTSLLCSYFIVLLLYASQSDYHISESDIDSSHITDYENDYDDRDHITLTSYHLHNNNNDVVAVEEVMSEGDEVVKNDDVDSIDFLFNNDGYDDDDDVDEALHLPPQYISHNIEEDDDVSLSDLFLDEEKE